ncbi:Kelch repeat-containing protein [Sandaracinus amylolyticus]|uniref:Kelch repeat-containing protein n=1 Tax=Sandaracinus amylolyticus TaxID=927083 RepID=UPI001F489245|nr:kelch repeat-containing protein [Sandaracinus amylolyticus]UJR84435.1 Hypothetical protein I5071_65140 [Sandaracinus amylolyticus]
MRRFLALALLLAACEDPLCSAGTEYDRSEKRCVCREPRVWTGEVCVYEPAGGDAGVAADASLDAAISSVPVLTTVGLSSYQPIAGELLRAHPGAIAGAGLSGIDVEYEWFIDDVSSGTESRLDTAALDAGQQVHLEAWARAGEIDGPRVRVGPVTVQAAPAWRPLLPHLSFSSVAVSYDERHSRWIVVSLGVAWETRVEAGVLRFTPLATTGAGPVAMHVVLGATIDPIHDRMYVVAIQPGISAAVDVFALDLADRGHERWTKLDASGSVSEHSRFISVLFDPATEVLWLLPGFDDGGELATVHALDVRREIPEWRSFPTPPGIEARGGAAVALAPSEPSVAYAFGGLMPDGTISDQVVRLSLDPADPRGELVEGVTLPSGLVGASAAVADGAIFVAGGVGALSSEGAQRGLVRFDPSASMLNTQLESFESADFLGVVARDPAGPGQALQYFRVAPDPRSSTVSLARLEGSAAAVLLASLDVPVGLSETSYHLGPDRTLAVRDGASSERYWQLDPERARWTSIPIAADPLSGRPLVREGIRSVGSARSDLVYLGTDAEGMPVDDGAWTVVEAPGLTWRRLAFATEPGGPTSMLSLPQRTGSSAVRASCRATTWLFGGTRTGTGALLDELWEVACREPNERQCEIRAASTSAIWPSARARTAIVATTQPVVGAWMFGGSTGAQSSASDVWFLDTCGGTFSAVMPDGDAPPPRSGHSAAAVERDGLAEIVYFGGIDRDADLDTSSYYDDAWRLTIRSPDVLEWARIEPTTTSRPSGRTGHTSILHRSLSSTTERLVVAGGRNRVSGSSSLTDAWELVLRP